MCQFDCQTYHFHYNQYVSIVHIHEGISGVRAELLGFIQSCFSSLSLSLSLSGLHVMTADCVRSGTPDVTDKSSLEEEKPLHFWHEEHSGCNKMPNVNIFNRHSETKLQIILIIIIQITATEPGWMAGCFFSVSGFLVHTHTHTHTHMLVFMVYGDSP